MTAEAQKLEYQEEKKESVLEFLLRRRREDSAVDVEDLLPLLEKALAAAGAQPDRVG